MISDTLWLVPVVPGTLILAYLWYAKATAHRSRRRAASETKRQKNIAHERAWNMIRGRNTRKRITHQVDDKA
jgi:hypothetical protein